MIRETIREGDTIPEKGDIGEKNMSDASKCDRREHENGEGHLTRKS
jgi:hypothetical protein